MENDPNVQTRKTYGHARSRQTSLYGTMSSGLEPDLPRVAYLRTRYPRGSLIIYREFPLYAARSATAWIRSGRCANSACVEVSATPDEVVVRNSTNPEGARVAFTHDEWIAFIGGVRDGDFDFHGTVQPDTRPN